MKIAVVVPFIPKIEGNRAAFLIAKALAIKHDTTVFAHTTVQTLIPEIRILCGDADFETMKTAEKGKFGVLFALNYQLFRRRTRQLSIFIKKHGAFNHIIVIANEAHWLPQYFENHRETKFSLLLMELHDRGMISFQQGDVRKTKVRSMLISPFYGLFKLFERDRFLSFDNIFANSTWTKTIFEYLYGIKIEDTIFAVDLELFMPLNELVVPEKFIAVPTASLRSEPEGLEIIRRLRDDGIPIKTYGSFQIPGFDNLGYLPDEEMVKLLSRASATLFLFNYEALGLIPFESLACGTPVITYDKQGPSLELKSNINVHFITSYTVLRDLCKRLISTDKTDDVVTQCRNSVMRYSAENVVDNLLSHLNGRV